MEEFDFGIIEGFDWDRGNIDKNWIKHKVAFWESEEIFANQPLLISADAKHSFDGEKRFYALGQTDTQRLLFEVFTVRNRKIRIISSRAMSQKENSIYQTHGRR